MSVMDKSLLKKAKLGFSKFRLIMPHLHIYTIHTNILTLSHTHIHRHTHTHTLTHTHTHTQTHTHTHTNKPTLMVVRFEFIPCVRENLFSINQMYTLTTLSISTSRYVHAFGYDTQVLRLFTSTPTHSPPRSSA